MQSFPFGQQLSILQLLSLVGGLGRAYLSRFDLC